MATLELARVAAAWAEGASADLQELLDCEVGLGEASVDLRSRDVLVASATAGGGALHAVLRTRDDARVPVHLVAPAASAHALAATRLGRALPEGAVATPLEPDAHDAFVECVELAAGILGRVLSEVGEFPGLEYESCEPLPDPLPADAALTAGDYRRLRVPVALAGAAAGELWLLFAEPVAVGWFGPPAEGAGDSALPLALIDPDPEARARAEELADALGRPIWTLDPAEFGPHSFDELSETQAVIVAWDLGGVVGLDLLEDLRRDPRTARVAVALATDAPTRDRVLMALRWGAATVLHQPLDAQEVARRLTPAAPS
jgi:CheY-like chemotaxis protein